MLTHPTFDQLRALKLDGMADAFVELEQQDAARDLSHGEWLALLLDREIANRTSKRTQIRLRAARLRYSQAAVEDVNYRAQRQLDKALFQQLATCRWIAEKRNLLVGGKCGLGKTWLACALAQRACREGYRAYYARMPRQVAGAISSSSSGGLCCWRALRYAALRIVPTVPEGQNIRASRGSLVKNVTDAVVRADGAKFEDVAPRVWVFPTGADFFDSIGPRLPTWADPMLTLNEQDGL